MRWCARASVPHCSCKATQPRFSESKPRWTNPVWVPTPGRFSSGAPSTGATPNAAAIGATVCAIGPATSGLFSHTFSTLTDALMCLMRRLSKRTCRSF